MRPTLISSLLTGSLVSGVLIGLTPQAAEAKAETFQCVAGSGTPTTVAVMSDGRRVPMIKWVSNEFSSDGWTPLRRCMAVSDRLTANKESLRYLTTGVMHGMNVICTAVSKGADCDQLIYTLKAGQNPGATLRRLFDVRTRATSALTETNEGTYVDINKLLGLGDSTDLPTINAGDNLQRW
jgi:Circadian oscillating protein COP23